MIDIKREHGLAPVITLTMPNAHLLRLAYVSKLCFWDSTGPMVSVAGAQERIYFFERLIDPPWDIIDPPWRTG